MKETQLLPQGHRWGHTTLTGVVSEMEALLVTQVCTLFLGYQGGLRRGQG